MVLDITSTLSNFSKLSYIGKYDKLLAPEVIATPGQLMYGATAGAGRDFLTKIFTPSEDLSTATSAILDQYNPQPVSYAAPGVMAVLLKKGTMELEAMDLGASRLKALIVELGMPADLLEDGVANLVHANSKASSSKAHFHLLSALLGAMATLSVEHSIFAAPAFLEDFPGPLLTDDEQGGEDESKSNQDGDGHEEAQGDGQDGQQEEVQMLGTRVSPRQVTLAPPLFGQPVYGGGATSTRPSLAGQV